MSEQFSRAMNTTYEEVKADGVSNVFPVGSLVRIANYSPFHGRKGIIRKVDNIFDDGEEPFCFYFVALEGTQITEPLWFNYDEVEFITSPLVALEP